MRTGNCIAAALAALLLAAPAYAQGVSVVVRSGDSADGAEPPPPHRHRRFRDRVIFFLEDRRDPVRPLALAPREIEKSAADGRAPEPEPEPLDPRGPVRATVAVPDRDLRLGQTVPSGAALVILHDWRSYGLAPPPAGQSYARLGSEILLVTVRDRRVMGLVDPPGSID